MFTKKESDEEQIRVEACTLLIKNNQRSLITATFVAFALVFIIKEHVSFFVASCWVSAILASYFARAMVCQLFLRDENISKNVEKWITLFRLACVCCGISWGFAPYFFHTGEIMSNNVIDNMEVLTFVLVVLAGILAGGIINLSIDTKSAQLFSFGLWFTAGPALLEHNNRYTIVIYILLAVFILFVYLGSKQLSEGLMQSIRLRLAAEKNEKEISDLTQRQSLHLEHTPMGIIEWDEQLNVAAWNNACTDIFGYNSSEALGKHISFFMPLFGSMQTQDIIACLHLENNQLKTLNHANNKTVYCEFSNTILRNEDGQFVGMASMVQNKTDFIASQEKIHQLAYYDALTGLANRSLLLEHISKNAILNKDKKSYNMLAFIDLDHFKAVNDLRGHNAGDHLLQTIATRLIENTRKQDTAARLGGDEFVLVLSDIGSSKKQAEAYAKKIISKIANVIKLPVEFEGHQHQCSASIGICLYTNEDLDAEELLRRADVAMYISKKQGGNAYHFYDNARQPEYEYSLKLKNDMNQAVELNQFELYLQGQYDRNSKMLGAEVLLRWNHPEYGMIMPNDFIQLAEETGAIIPIGYWILNRACELLKKWQADENSSHLMISVNVSAVQFSDPSLIQQIEKAIKKTGCNPHKLCIELTESSVITNMQESIEKMHQIKALGVSIAIDDFGTGYSSLAALKNMPVNELKIDKSFVKDFTINPVDLTIVQTILQMGKNLDLRIVAEGVETEGQMAHLSNYGCNRFQGYFFAKPCTISKFESIIDKEISLPKLVTNEESLVSQTKKTVTVH